jgi:hypothetical protein
MFKRSTTTTPTVTSGIGVSVGFWMAGGVFVGGSVGVVPTVVAAGAQLARKRIPMNNSGYLAGKFCFAIFVPPMSKHDLGRCPIKKYRKSRPPSRKEVHKCFSKMKGLPCPKVLDWITKANEV